jgi:endonuclease/exonuclease/phosphatase family metal-dependent hydrolase
MKLVSYNLRYGGNTANTEKVNHWQQLIKEFVPDIVFAQESHHPERYFSSSDEFSQFKGCVHSNVHHGKWGSAILSKNHKLEEVSLSVPEYEGWVVGARIPDLLIGGVVQPVLIFSIHAPSLSTGSYEQHVNRILDEIVKQWGNTPMILAGDFNLTTAAIRHPSEALKNTTGEIKILERLRVESGLVNAWQSVHPKDDLPQTLRWSGNTATPYHCDAIFLSEKFLPYLLSAVIPSTGVWGEISDHNPVIVTLN